MRVALSLAVLVAAHGCAAQEIPLHGLTHPAQVTETEDEQRGAEAGWFTTLGSPGRLWEMRTDSAFSSNRALTERVELAHFFSVSQYETTEHTAVGEQFGIVVRANFGLADDTTNSIYNPLGPLPAIGVRLRTPSDREWIEFGVRALIPYPGPSNALPGMQTLAFKATTSSGIADDAAWLPLDSWGAQLYLATQVRMAATNARGTLFAIGVSGGGQISLGSVNVTTWLGPQPTFLGNAYIEFFADIQRFRVTQLNLQIGAHAEASLSACWPGPSSLPILVNGYVGWSPIRAFALRIFYGSGESIAALFSGILVQQYGVRAQVFFP